MWKTEIYLKELDKEKVKQMCEKIKEKDSTFDFKIENNYLMMFSPDRNTSIKRGLLFAKKYFKDFGDFGFNISYEK